MVEQGIGAGDLHVVWGPFGIVWGCLILGGWDCHFFHTISVVSTLRSHTGPAVPHVQVGETALIPPFPFFLLGNRSKTNKEPRLSEKGTVQIQFLIISCPAKM